MSKIVDLSHPITDKAPCTFGTADKVPIITFEEGDSHGLFFVTSRIDNLYSNAGTQIDFPGHLVGVKPTSAAARTTYSSVGEYPLERFIGKVAVLDFSSKMENLESWFDDRGVFNRDRIGQFDEFVATFERLEINVDDLTGELDRLDVNLEELIGLLIFSGSGKYWSNEVFESWEYRYFYAPYFSMEAAQLLADTSSISLVGIDAFQIEDPVANFRGNELPLMINSKAREYVRTRLASWLGDTNHERLLGNGILIYESVRLPLDVAGKVGEFSGVPLNLQLPGLDDDAVTRPYLLITG